ncbi:sterile alpha motif domain-containing protein 15-like isoform X1 [Saccostrea cucullata]|uniref:sterile alpha motif domain-containing protein 15-like n=1 Tax=Saccostrea cuccullata TaxID=36930 RepID=UPI002ED02EDA
MSTMESAIEDLKDDNVPPCLYWSVEKVAEWIEKIGFPNYTSCITTNLIDGRKLITLEASQLPNIGITDFQHIKTITKAVRELLFIEDPDWKRSISLPPREDLGMYLERKSHNGKNLDGLTYKSFLLNLKDSKWQPPLANHCLILPRS